MTLSSELVRSVLQSAPDAMVIIDGSGTILFANRQVTALFGYAAAEVVGSPVEMLLPERFRSRHVTHRKGYTSAVRVRPMGAGLELFARRKDGGEFPVEISLSPIQEHGDILVAAAIRDVTDRARAEKELRDARAAADRANLSKSRFLATASHDLRQPLQVLSLLNGTLRRLVPDGDALEVLEQQEQALGTMSRLLSALLDISKLESGAIMPDICEFSVAQLLAELRLEYGGLATSKGLDFIVEDADMRARSDPTLIGQALKNLVANAIKYTSAGAVSLRASALPDAVRIEVCDTGRGIAPESLPYIFDEFYQVGVATNTSRDGYGLGLSIVQRVVRLLELRIEVSSQPGTGSTFALVIPASQSTATGSAAPRGKRSETAARGGNAHHLLLVEDDAGVRNATRLFLKGEGYQVSTAASFEEAVQVLERHAGIELVISDYHLEGGRTGAQVIAAARERFGPAYPAILVTGDTTPAMASLKLDATLRLTSKPINADDLVGLIQALLPR
ncbi:MAG TPA: PAS domain S-box protein [Steroidobacteraceae bacterium]|nr:PAS domain S-box protein [Steroidobacteraceae bacterium]